MWEWRSGRDRPNRGGVASRTPGCFMRQPARRFLNFSEIGPSKISNLPFNVIKTAGIAKVGQFMGKFLMPPLAPPVSSSGLVPWCSVFSPPRHQANRHPLLN